MEGTSEASLAASAPREAQMLYQPKEPGPGPEGRTAVLAVTLASADLRFEPGLSSRQ
jgi:hypothetical protein